jgi:hypothetical protein
MKRSSITGGCYCGEVRFNASSAPFHLANCHCENCRRAIGAQAVAWITVKRADFRYDKGSPTKYHTETGAWRAFCSRCGTSLTYYHDDRPDELDITTASLDHPEAFAPTRDVFPDEKLPWVGLIGKKS